ncbi:uncharacterized protein F4822DRAFT_388232 [Hypoxylon trugodes]|uniref:uncharacterized protein n=1 Tax=Hypoxylon trugodes TaxID=326681 RepID=UPI00219CEB39|nr:uncharacterized protein F4822DRAFT_388232 [Hypoxylon trugodes]KAI1394449.1 hypothetical protein F4822DRAFT_388232 [Hypoxylon trugodes]
MNQMPSPPGLKPPFKLEFSLVGISSITHPAAVRSSVRTLILPSRDLEAYLVGELNTNRLSRLHKHLWLAGLPVPARPLHRQRLVNRAVVVTERADEHLVWHEHRIFIKPLPAFLLCHAFWEEHLCTNPILHASACGFLLSYAWLVAHRSDFAIANDSRLMPPDVTWEQWTKLSSEVLGTLDLDSMAGIDLRYHYGELRLSRLDMLTRWPLVAPELWSPRKFVDGYMSSSTWYKAFFERHFGWLVVGFVYVSVVLSALQVGLATESLSASSSFQNLGLGVTLAGLVALVLALGSIVLVWLVLFWYHVLSTLAFVRKVRFQRERKALDKNTSF